MRKLLTLSILALLTANISASELNRNPHKDSGWYLSANASYYHQNGKVANIIHKVNREIIPGIGLGYKFNDMFRLEYIMWFGGGVLAQVFPLYIDSPYNTRTKTYPGINFHYDIYTTTIFTPYITLGIGSVMIEKTSSNRLVESDSMPNSSLGFGSRVQLTAHVDLDMGYKYSSDMLKSKEVALGVSIDQHQATVGLIYNF